MSDNHKILTEQINITTLAQWHVWITQNTCLPMNIELEVSTRSRPYYDSFLITVYDSEKESSAKMVRFLDALDFVYWPDTHPEGLLDHDKALAAILELEEFLLNGAKK